MCFFDVRKWGGSELAEIGIRLAGLSYNNPLEFCNTEKSVFFRNLYQDAIRAEQRIASVEKTFILESCVEVWQERAKSGSST